MNSQTYIQTEKTDTIRQTDRFMNRHRNRKTDTKAGYYVQEQTGNETMITERQTNR